MRVLVCGGRNYKDCKRVWRALDRWHLALSITEVVHGAATGVDTMAGFWAKKRGLVEIPCPMDIGESGFDRNLRMLAKHDPDAVIHFPGGNGTRHMRNAAIHFFIPVYPGLAAPPESTLDL